VETALAPNQTPEPQAEVKSEAGEPIESAKQGASLSAQADLQAALNLKLNASRLTVGPTAPASPQVNDLWVDTN